MQSRFNLRLINILRVLFILGRSIVPPLSSLHRKSLDVVRSPYLIYILRRQHYSGNKIPTILQCLSYCEYFPPILTMDLEKKFSSEKPRSEDVDEAMGVGEVLNASGHKQELERNFSLLSLCAIGITTGNVWAALGGSIVRLFPPVLTIANKQVDANLF